MEQPIWQTKKEMCEIGHRIWQRGFCAGNEGNHSVRISDDRVLCTPTGISKGFLTPDDICVVDMDGTQVEPNAKGRRRTSEVLVHLAIYKKREDVRAVVHSHPPHAVAFCIAGMEVPNSVHPEAEVFLGQILHAQYATPGTPELPASFLDKIGPETNTILMSNHGSVNFADTLQQAYYSLEILDNYCKQLILAKQVGNINVLNPQQMEALLEVKEGFGIPDARRACALDGCVGQQDQPFVTSFDGRTASAVSNASGACQCQSETKLTPGSAEFEAMVQSVTDAIMTGFKNN